MNSSFILITFLHNIIVYNIPLLYGTVGEIMVEKSGSLNLGVEGTMAVGAMFGYIAGCRANSFLVGLIVAFISGALCGLIFAVLTVTLQANQNITGLTLTTFGLGVFFFVGNGVKAVEWPVLQNFESMVRGFADIEIPGLSQIPGLGRILFSQNSMVYMGIIIAVLVWIYLRHTRVGLRTRAIGENPAAADSVGINIVRYKYLNIMVGSGIMGLGGLYMGLNLNGSLSSTVWTNGYGWIAVALVIFANWSPIVALLGTFIFGFFNTLQVSGTSLAAAFPGLLGWLSRIPTQLYQALPFVITAVVLIVTSMKKSKSTG
ncbi:MAG: ABC transporter permease, partial [Lachnospiraceae bacterium]|nr:ABC transporter permease [Lachnospiraceae bacterium]